MYKVKFKNICEIRMGSPFNSAELEVIGGILPELKGHSFQDKFLVSADGNQCLLVQWATEDNEPGFIVWKLNDVDGSLTKSKRIEGCCEKLSEVNGVTEAFVWRYDHQKRSASINSELIAWEQ